MIGHEHKHKPQYEIPRIVVSVIMDRMVRTILVIISLALLCGWPSVGGH